MAVLALLVAGGTWFWQKSAPATGASYQGQVVAVADGDTITVLEHGRKHKIRFAFVDAPESSQRGGQDAKGHLQQRVQGQTVSVEVQERDRYGREVARVRLQGQDLNYEQVALGWAWHYKQYAQKGQSSADFRAYAQAEAQARTARLGLWQQADPTPPWSYRAARR